MSITPAYVAAITAAVNAAADHEPAGDGTVFPIEGSTLVVRTAPDGLHVEAASTPTPKTVVHPDRAGLIDLATRGVVPVEHWRNRDSAAAQMQLGEARALLAAGCEFAYDPTEADDGKTHWVTIDYPGFNAFEEGRHDTTTWDDHTFYIPTADRLEHANGEDWY